MSTYIFGKPLSAAQTTSYETMFEACKAGAEKEGFTYFGVQHKMECWGSHNADKRYNIYGCKKNCLKNPKGIYGTGTDWSNFVYRKSVLTPNKDGSGNSGKKTKTTTTTTTIFA